MLSHSVVERLGQFALNIAFFGRNHYFNRNQGQEKDHKTGVKIKSNIGRKRDVPHRAEQHGEYNRNYFGRLFHGGF